MPILKRLLERVGNNVGRLVHVAQAVRFVNDHEVPRRVCDIRRLVAGKLVGTDNDRVTGFEGLEIPGLDRGVIGLGFQNLAGQEKLFGQFLMPLLAQIGRRDDQNTAFPFCPSLRQHQPGLDGFAQTHFIRKQCAFGQRRVKRKQCGIHLMRIQIDLRTGNRAGKLFDAIGRAPFGQLVGKVFCMVRRYFHS